MELNEGQKVMASVAARLLGRAPTSQAQSSSSSNTPRFVPSSQNSPSNNKQAPMAAAPPASRAAAPPPPPAAPVERGRDVFMAEEDRGPSLFGSADQLALAREFSKSSTKGASKSRGSNRSRMVTDDRGSSSSVTSSRSSPHSVPPAPAFASGPSKPAMSGNTRPGSVLPTTASKPPSSFISCPRQEPPPAVASQSSRAPPVSNWGAFAKSPTTSKDEETKEKITKLSTNPSTTSSASATLFPASKTSISTPSAFKDENKATAVKETPIVKTYSKDDLKSIGLLSVSESAGNSKQESKPIAPAVGLTDITNTNKSDAKPTASFSFSNSFQTDKKDTSTMHVFGAIEKDANAVKPEVKSKATTGLSDTTSTTKSDAKPVTAFGSSDITPVKEQSPDAKKLPPHLRKRAEALAKKAADDENARPSSPKAQSNEAALKKVDVAVNAGDLNGSPPVTAETKVAAPVAARGAKVLPAGEARSVTAEVLPSAVDAAVKKTGTSVKEPHNKINVEWQTGAPAVKEDSDTAAKAASFAPATAAAMAPKETTANSTKVNGATVNDATEKTTEKTGEGLMDKTEGGTMSEKLMDMMKLLKAEVAHVNNRVKVLEKENFDTEKQLQQVMQAEERRKFLGSHNAKSPFNIDVTLMNGLICTVQVSMDTKINDLIRRLRAKLDISPPMSKNPRITVGDEQVGHLMTLGEVGVSNGISKYVGFSFDVV